jgi:transposase-like protein
MRKNPVNRRCNRYFTQEEKEEILDDYYNKNFCVLQIAEKHDSLPNHITWYLLRWKPACIPGFDNTNIDEIKTK